MPPAESRVFRRTLGGIVRKDSLHSLRAPFCLGEPASNRCLRISKEPFASLTWYLLHRQLTITAGTLRNSAGKQTHTGLTFPLCCLYYQEGQTSQLLLQPQSAVVYRLPGSPQRLALPGALLLPPQLLDL